MPPDLFPQVEKLVEFNTSGSPTFLQHAGIVAIRQGEDFIAAFVARCRVARDLAIDALQGCRRVEVVRPEGAFYAFPRITSTGFDSATFAERLLEEEHVAVVPGSAFGPSGEGHVRACYATAWRRCSVLPMNACMSSPRMSAARSVSRRDPIRNMRRYVLPRGKSAGRCTGCRAARNHS